MVTPDVFKKLKRKSLEHEKRKVPGRTREWLQGKLRQGKTAEPLQQGVVQRKRDTDEGPLRLVHSGDRCKDLLRQLTILKQNAQEAASILQDKETELAAVETELATAKWQAEKDGVLATSNLGARDCNACGVRFVPLAPVCYSVLRCHHESCQECISTVLDTNKARHKDKKGRFQCRVCRTTGLRSGDLHICEGGKECKLTVTRGDEKLLALIVKRTEPSRGKADTKDDSAINRPHKKQCKAKH